MKISTKTSNEKSMKGQKLTLKQQKWVSLTAETLNPTEAARRVYDIKNDDTAKSIASENLAKPYLQQALDAKMLELGIDEHFLLTEHKKIIEQDRNLPAKNTAIDMAYRLKGVYAAEKHSNFNLNIPQTVEELEKEIKLLAQELDRIDEIGEENPVSILPIGKNRL